MVSDLLVYNMAILIAKVISEVVKAFSGSRTIEERSLDTLQSVLINKQYTDD